MSNYLSKRERVWLNAWCAVASAFNCMEPESAARWADHALIEFDKRFPKQREVSSGIGSEK